MEKQPGGKGALLVVAVQVLVGAEEGLLSGVFRQFRFAQHAVAQVKYGGLIGLDEFGKRFVAALLGFQRPGLFFVHERSFSFTALFLRRPGEKVAPLPSLRATLPKFVEFGEGRVGSMVMPLPFGTENLLPPPKRL